MRSTPQNFKILKNLKWLFRDFAKLNEFKGIVKILQKHAFTPTKST